jgi:hypothetical protein
VSTLLGSDAGLQIIGVDTELRGQPLERVSRRAGLTALDLADVLLREPPGGQIGLGQTGVCPKGANSLPDSFLAFDSPRRSEVSLIDST